MSQEIKDRAVIIGASAILDTSFLRTIGKDFLTVACDGGYYHFLREQAEPDLLIGDFDTLDETLVKNPGKIYKLNPIKDDTDTFWAVKFLLSEGYREIHFYGCLGQKIEHTLGNIQLLSYLSEKGIRGYLHTPDDSEVLFMLSSSYVTFRKEAHGKISVLSYDGVAHGVSETNLRYPLNKADLTSSVPLGVSNEFIGKEATVSVENGRLLIIAPKDSL
jgi:thiamine pyrophosphokinase